MHRPEKHRRRAQGAAAVRNLHELFTAYKHVNLGMKLITKISRLLISPAYKQAKKIISRQIKLLLISSNHFSCQIKLLLISKNNLGMVLISTMII